MMCACRYADMFSQTRKPQSFSVWTLTVRSTIQPNKDSDLKLLKLFTSPPPPLPIITLLFPSESIILKP